MSIAEPVNVPFFKKTKKTRPTTTRQRSTSPPAGSTSVPSTSAVTSSTTKSQVVLPSRKAQSNLLSAGSKRKNAQRGTGEDDGDDNYGEESERDGPDVKWSSSKSHINAALEIIAGDEADEVLARRRKKEKLDAGQDSDNEDVPDDGLYRGQKKYQSHLKKSQEVPKAMRVGPQRSTNTIRTVTITDYQPDVCKDYKETGYCGFGDTCKFLHDRGTYLAGWQLDAQFDKSSQSRVNNDGGSSDSDSDSDSEDIPFACLICRKHYTDPIVTRCGHYFCSACAIKRFAKTPKCLACGAPTGGMFNRADKVIERINKKRAEKESREGRDGEDGEGRGDVVIEGLDGGGGEGSENGED